jgi:pimeloyl-ACP methyl ester carboxylesterase
MNDRPSGVRPVSATVGAYRWHRVGAGPPLVLVHGLAGSWRWWRPLLPALAAEFTLHLVDLPGFGRLPRVRAFALEDALAWLEGWFAAADIDAADLVGHSLGALLAARLAARHPERVRRLVLVAPAGVHDGGALAVTQQLARVVLASRPRFFALLVRDAARSGPVTIATAAFELLASDLRVDVASVTAPTLVVVGRSDPLVPPAHGAQLAAALPHAIVRELDAGHVPMADRPDELTRELLDFLRRDA